MINAKIDLVLGTFRLKAEIHDSGAICVSGANGSGKTTLLRAIAGEIKPDSGDVRVNSRNVTNLPPERREIVLVTPDSMIPHLQVEKHLVWGASTKGKRVEEVELAEVKATLGISYGGRVDRLSLGMRERVSLATALLSVPKVILVDEAFANIDHREDFVRSFFGLCHARSIDVVHSTQVESDAALSDHHYSITGGETARIS